MAADVRARLSTWDYRRILTEYFPAVVTAAGLHAFALLCDRLDEAIHIARGESKGGSQEDASFIWRSAIEHDPRGDFRGIENALVSAIRDATEQLLASDPGMIKGIVRTLEEHRWPIFQRLALYVLSRHPTAAPELVARYLADRELFDNARVQHEYALLARSGFAQLSDDEKEAILSWAAEAPDVESLAARFEQGTGAAPTAEETERLVEQWQLRRLEFFRSGLPEEWQTRYDELIQQVGPPPDPAQVWRSEGVWVGPTSPVSAKNLLAMSPEEMLQFLKTWRPSGDLFDHSLEGLGGTLTEAVASEPERIATDAERFREVPPALGQALLRGLEEALKRGREFRWAEVLTFCQWIVEQPRSSLDVDTGHRGFNWGDVRKNTADLILAGVEADVGAPPLEARAQLWSILEALAEDPEPTPGYEAKYGGTNMTPAELSLNTTRARAIHAVIRYAVWVRRQSDEATRETASPPEIPPEVRDVLDRHLDPGHDPSTAVRAVYGWSFPVLLWLDPAWAAGSISRIFPADGESDHLWDAAWDAYVAFNRLFPTVFVALRAEYDRAIGHLDVEPRGLRPARQDPDERLADHLMTLFWHGRLGFGEPDRLLERFYQHAPAAVRSHALDFLGRSLDELPEESSEEVLPHLRDLLEWRIAAAGDETVPGSVSKELEAFGSWFISGKFDDTWAIARLEEVLKLSGAIEPDWQVVERLAALSPELPAAAVECLGLMIDGDRQGWHIGMWKEGIRSILSAAIQSTDRAAREASRALINRLGARGFLEFRDLLEA